MELIAHRGCGAHYPENTVHAVERASTRLPAVEVDVRRCGSDELVCVHDETVDRVTDGSGRVADLTLTELRELEVQGSGEPIPTLADVVAALGVDTTLQVELKETGLVTDVCSVLDGAERSTVRLSSFEPPALREAQDSGVPTGYLFGGVPAENVALAADLGCANVHPHWQDCAETDVVERAHARGFAVYAWGGETDPKAVSAAREAGADGLTVDRPDF